MKSSTKKIIFIGYFILVLFLGNLFSVMSTPTQTNISSKRTTLSSDDFSFNKIKLSSVPYSNATVISDGYGGVWGWNTGNSWGTSIAVDGSGNLYTVWDDQTQNSVKWGNDGEIMYAKWTLATGWSNATVISDGYNGAWGWNMGDSWNPSIAVDSPGNVYVVWDDQTDNSAKWGIDREIMYVNYSVVTDKWSNATVISDGYNGVWGWNKGDSFDPSIVVDASGNVHVVWYDATDNSEKWGIDWEIMYAKWTLATGWSNATVISDGYNGIWGWNTGDSQYPSIAVDGPGNVHVVWHDATDNSEKWDVDWEIMYAKWTLATGWSNATLISDGYNGAWGWNMGDSWNPSIAVDSPGNVHVVWYDNSPGKWRYDITDSEIMYAKWTLATGWSNATVISDGYNGVWGWNDGTSERPSIAVDGSDNIHVVWRDDTNNSAKWAVDLEIMYAKWTLATDWCNATVISDGYNDVWGWNSDKSWFPSITVDGSDNIHVVWSDNTNNSAKWGVDWEIMYVKIQPPSSIYYPLAGDDDDDDDGGGLVLSLFWLLLLIGIVLGIIAIVAIIIIIKKKK